jgi:hypothetical protein
MIKRKISCPLRSHRDRALYPGQAANPASTPSIAITKPKPIPAGILPLQSSVSLSVSGTWSSANTVRDHRLRSRNRYRYRRESSLCNHRYPYRYRDPGRMLTRIAAIDCDNETDTDTGGILPLQSPVSLSVSGILVECSHGLQPSIVITKTIPIPAGINPLQSSESLSVSGSWSSAHTVRGHRLR